MTKPIEGWVRMDVNSEVSRWILNEDIESGKVPDGEDPLYYTELFFSLPRSDFGQVYKPVLVTLKDEPNTEIADAIRKERERIWKEVNDVWPNWYPEMRKAIFGEEK